MKSGRLTSEFQLAAAYPIVATVVVTVLEAIRPESAEVAQQVLVELGKFLGVAYVGGRSVVKAGDHLAKRTATSEPTPEPQWTGGPGGRPTYPG